MKASSLFADFLAIPNADIRGRSKFLLGHLLQEDVPAFLSGDSPATLVRCTSETVIDGAHYTLEYYVKPNYLAVGEDDDFLLAPLVESDLQYWCDQKPLKDSDGNSFRKWFIPPAYLLRETWRQTACKIDPQAIPLAFWSVHQAQAVINEQAMILKAMAAKGCPPSAFVRCKKAYNTAPGVSWVANGNLPDHLHFTGWWYPDGTGGGINPGKWGIQGHDTTGGHDAWHADYSHGCDVVFGQCFVNGVEMWFDEVCNHPKLWPLVSDQGPFNPRFPNTGPGVLPPSSTGNVPKGDAPPANYQGAKYSTGSNGVVAQSSPDLRPAGASTPTPTPASSAGKIVLGLGLGLGALWGLSRLLKSPPVHF